MNTFLTPTWYLKDVMVGWKNSVKLVGNFTREYSDAWKNKPEGVQIGYTVYVRLPNRPIVNEGQAIQVQPRINQAVPVSITHQLQIASEWSSADDALLVEEVRERYTKPDGEAIGNRCDVLAGQEFDVAFVGFLSIDCFNAAAVVRLMKELHPSKPLVVGGLHVSIAKEYVFPREDLIEYYLFGNQDNLPDVFKDFLRWKGEAKYEAPLKPDSEEVKEAGESLATPEPVH